MTNAELSPLVGGIVLGQGCIVYDVFAAVSFPPLSAYRFGAFWVRWAFFFCYMLPLPPG